jgi:hypothetical protein
MKYGVDPELDVAHEQTMAKADAITRNMVNHMRSGVAAHAKVYFVPEAELVKRGIPETADGVNTMRNADGTTDIYINASRHSNAIDKIKASEPGLFKQGVDLLHGITPDDYYSLAANARGILGHEALHAMFKALPQEVVDTTLAKIKETYTDTELQEAADRYNKLLGNNKYTKETIVNEIAADLAGRQFSALTGFAEFQMPPTMSGKIASKFEGIVDKIGEALGGSRMLGKTNLALPQTKAGARVVRDILTNYYRIPHAEYQAKVDAAAEAAKVAAKAEAKTASKAKAKTEEPSTPLYEPKMTDFEKDVLGASKESPVDGIVDGKPVKIVGITPPIEDGSGKPGKMQVELADGTEVDVDKVQLLGTRNPVQPDLTPKPKVTTQEPVDLQPKINKSGLTEEELKNPLDLSPGDDLADLEAVDITKANENLKAERDLKARVAADRWLRSATDPTDAAQVANYKEMIINADGTIDAPNVTTNVVIDDQMLVGGKLPVKFRSVAGNFDARDAGLTSLKGAPDKVGGRVFLEGNPNLPEAEVTAYMKKLSDNTLAERGLKPIPTQEVAPMQVDEIDLSPGDDLVDLEVTDITKANKVLDETARRTSDELGGEFTTPDGTVVTFRPGPQSAGMLAEKQAILRELEAAKPKPKAPLQVDELDLSPGDDLVDLEVIDTTKTDEPARLARVKQAQAWVDAHDYVVTNKRKVAKPVYVGDDGLVNVDGDITIYPAGKISTRFGKVDGDMTVNGAQSEAGGALTSLDGSPREVTGGFYVTESNLTDLTGGPERVGGNYIAHSLGLKSLDGAPKEVVGKFDVGDNNLTSLKGSPARTGSFNAANNGLTSLDGGPAIVDGDYNVSGNNLTDLKGAPNKVQRNLHLENNDLTSLDGAPDYLGGRVLLDENPNLPEAEVEAYAKRLSDATLGIKPKTLQVDEIDLSPGTEPTPEGQPPTAADVLKSMVSDLVSKEVVKQVTVNKLGKMVEDFKDTGLAPAKAILQGELDTLAPEGKPTGEFWKIWRNQKEDLMAIGVKVKKNDETQEWSVTVGKPTKSMSDKVADWMTKPKK